MFSDPQSVTINAVANPLPRIGVDGGSSTYANADGTLMLTVSHETTPKSRERHQVKLSFRKVAQDPVSLENAEYTGSVYIVIDAPDPGFTVTELRNYALGLTAWLPSATLDRVISGES